MGVPYTFATATTSIPLSELDANFNTPITLGNTAVYLGNTTTSIGNLTLTNVIISSGLLSNATIPVANGTVMLSGNMPAFSAYQSSAQTLTGSSFTKVTFDTKEFDTNNNFASNRFTPTVAGYYQVSSAVSINGVALNNYFLITIYKNGSRFKDGCNYPTSSAAGAVSAVSALVYFNGTTDYVEIYSIVNQTVNTSASAAQAYFQAVMVRAA